MKYLLSFIILTIATELRSQTTDDVLFNFDKEFKFEHFKDHWVTRELNRVDGQHIIDTIYSCNYNNEGKVLRERIYKDGRLMDGIRFFNYDSNERVVNELFYEESQLGKDFGNIHVQQSRYVYDKESQLAQIITSKCFKTLTERTNRKLDSIRKNPSQDLFLGGISSFSEYSDNWACKKNDVRVIYTYNSYGLKTSAFIYFDIHPESITKYFYDEENRLRRTTYCQFGYKGDHPNRDTNTCQWVTDESFEYTDSSTSVLQTEELMANKINNRTDTIFNANGLPTRVLEHIHQVYEENEIQHEREFQTKTLYFYDELDRLKRKETFHDDFEPTIYKYFYKKK